MISFTDLSYLETSGPRLQCSAILYLVFLGLFEGITQNGYLYKCKFLLKKLTTRTHKSYLPFYCNFQEKQFLNGILGRKNHCIIVRGEFRTLPNINDKHCVKSVQIRNFSGPCSVSECKKIRTRKTLNTPIASFWCLFVSFEHISHFVLVFLLLLWSSVHY